MGRLVVSVVLVCGACRPDPETQSVEPAAAPVSTPRVPDQSPPAEPAGGDEGEVDEEAAAEETCVAECILGHQMQAMAPEVIEANCRRSCIEPHRP
jgi:hypothetical protein